MKISGDLEFKLLAAGVLVAAALGLAWYLKNKSGGSGSVVSDVSSGVASGIVSTVGNAATGAATGAVIGLGDVLGIPATNQSECDLAIAEGRTWDASFACPAGRWLKSLVG